MARQAGDYSANDTASILAIWYNETGNFGTKTGVHGTNLWERGADGEIGPIQITPPAREELGKFEIELPAKWNTDVAANLSAGGSYYSLMRNRFGRKTAARRYNGSGPGAETYQKKFDKNYPVFKQLENCINRK